MSDDREDLIVDLLREVRDDVRALDKRLSALEARPAGPNVGWVRDVALAVVTVATALQAAGVIRAPMPTLPPPAPSAYVAQP